MNLNSLDQRQVELVATRTGLEGEAALTSAIELGVAYEMLAGGIYRKLIFDVLGENGHKFFLNDLAAATYKAGYKLYKRNVDPSAAQIVLAIRKETPDVKISQIAEMNDLTLGGDYRLWAHEVRQRCIKRHASDQVKHLAAALGNGHSPDQLAKIAEKVNSEIKMLSDTNVMDMPAVLEQYELDVTAVADGTRKPGPRLGFWNLDSKIGELEPGNFLILAARPSVGKSAFAINVAYRNLLADRSVFFFSLEMSRNQVLSRMMAASHQFQVRRLKAGDKSELPRLKAARAWLETRRFYLDDTSNARLGYLLATLRQHTEQHGAPELIIIDYLQLMSGFGKPENRQTEVSEISKNLKLVAKELKSPVIALSQLSREAATEEPQSHHLRESGSLEQDADIILMLWQDKADEHTIRAKTTKVRDGPLAYNVPITYTKNTQRMVSRNPDTNLDDEFPEASGVQKAETEWMF